MLPFMDLYRIALQVDSYIQKSEHDESQTEEHHVISTETAETSSDREGIHEADDVGSETRCSNIIEKESEEPDLMSSLPTAEAYDSIQMKDRYRKDEDLLETVDKEKDVFYTTEIYTKDISHVESTYTEHVMSEFITTKETSKISSTMDEITEEEYILKRESDKDALGIHPPSQLWDTLADVSGVRVCSDILSPESEDSKADFEDFRADVAHEFEDGAADEDILREQKDDVSEDDASDIPEAADYDVRDDFPATEVAEHDDKIVTLLEASEPMKTRADTGELESAALAVPRDESFSGSDDEVSLPEEGVMRKYEHIDDSIVEEEMEGKPVEITVRDMSVDMEDNQMEGTDVAIQERIEPDMEYGLSDVVGDDSVRVLEVIEGESDLTEAHDIPVLEADISDDQFEFENRAGGYFKEREVIQTELNSKFTMYEARKTQTTEIIEVQAATFHREKIIFDDRFSQSSDLESATDLEERSIEPDVKMFEGDEKLMSPSSDVATLTRMHDDSYAAKFEDPIHLGKESTDEGMDLTSHHEHIAVDTSAPVTIDPTHEPLQPVKDILSTHSDNYLAEQANLETYQRPTADDDDDDRQPRVQSDDDSDSDSDSYPVITHHDYISMAVKQQIKLQAEISRHHLLASDEFRECDLDPYSTENVTLKEETDLTRHIERETAIEITVETDQDTLKMYPESTHDVTISEHIDVDLLGTDDLNRDIIDEDKPHSDVADPYEMTAHQTPFCEVTGELLTYDDKPKSADAEIFMNEGKPSIDVSVDTSIMDNVYSEHRDIMAQQVQDTIDDLLTGELSEEPTQFDEPIRQPDTFDVYEDKRDDNELRVDLYDDKQDDFIQSESLLDQQRADQMQAVLHDESETVLMTNEEQQEIPAEIQTQELDSFWTSDLQSNTSIYHQSDPADSLDYQKPVDEHGALSPYQSAMDDSLSDEGVVCGEADDEADLKQGPAYDDLLFFQKAPSPTSSTKSENGSLQADDGSSNNNNQGDEDKPSRPLSPSDYTLETESDAGQQQDDLMEPAGRVSADMSQQIFLEQSFEAMKQSDEFDPHDLSDNAMIDSLTSDTMDDLLDSGDGMRDSMRSETADDDRPPSPSEYTLMVSQEQEELAKALGISPKEKGVLESYQHQLGLQTAGVTDAIPQHDEGR